MQQTDGNLVLYDLSTGQPLWATMTGGNAGAYAVLQGDGNFVVYSSTARALWYSHTYTFSGLVLNVQTDGNVVIYNGTTPLWATGTDTGERQCWTTNSCSPQSFAYAILGRWPEAPVTGVLGVSSASNIYAIEKWEARETGGGGCGSQTPGPWPTHAPPNSPYGPAGNPLGTTQSEPGSSPTWNSIGVQIYRDYNGQTCWYWGIKGTDDTFNLNTAIYKNIINVLRSPSMNLKTQCVALAKAVYNNGVGPRWGTGDFSASC